MKTASSHRVATTGHAKSESAKDFQEFLHSLPIAACVLNTQGCIVGLNAEAEKLLEWGETSCRGRSLHELIDCLLQDEIQARSLCPIEQVIQSGMPVWIPRTRLRTRSGLLKPVEYRSAPFVSASGSYVIITWRDMSQQLQLESDRYRLASIPEESPNPIVEFDSNAMLLYANPIMTELISQFGFSDDTYPVILPPQVGGIVQECLHSGRTRGGFTVTQEGYSYEWTFSPVPRTSLVRGYGVNLTERLRMEEELRQAKDEAEAANQVKSEFLATISHELRTPMNGIMGMTELLSMTPLTSEQQEYTEIVKHSAKILLSLVNDILDFSKIEARRLELEYRDFHLTELIKQTIALFAPQAQEKGVALHCDIAPEVPPMFRGDPDRLRQVLVNVVGNALKFTAHGEVVLEVKNEEAAWKRALSPQDYNRLIFFVRDTGIGIPANRLGRLFKVFSQIDSSTTRQYGGVGLGLAISKRLVELMGGEIGVESIPGQGSTFWFTLRLEPRVTLTSASPIQDEGPQAEILSPSVEEKRTSIDEALIPSNAVRLLLVEDNPINQKLAVRLLKKFGYEVDVASNGREALDLFSHRSYTVILMDCQMPEMDGFEATRAIRTWEAQQETKDGTTNTEEPASAFHPTVFRVPIIALTANAIQGDKERCLAVGMDDYITKPISPAALKATLTRWLTHPPHRSPK
jgi:PAS domain S-box-containing protein